MALSGASATNDRRKMRAFLTHSLTPRIQKRRQVFFLPRFAKDMHPVKPLIAAASVHSISQWNRKRRVYKKYNTNQSRGCCKSMRARPLLSHAITGYRRRCAPSSPQDRRSGSARAWFRRSCQKNCPIKSGHPTRFESEPTLHRPERTRSGHRQ